MTHYSARQLLYLLIFKHTLNIAQGICGAILCAKTHCLHSYCTRGCVELAICVYSVGHVIRFHQRGFSISVDENKWETLPKECQTVTRSADLDGLKSVTELDTPAENSIWSLWPCALGRFSTKFSVKYRYAKAPRDL